MQKRESEELTENKESSKEPETELRKVFPWETAWVKKLDASNPDDVEAYKNIDAQPEVSKWMVGDIMNTKEIKELFSDK
jgi:hypothetical protein